MVDVAVDVSCGRGRVFLQVHACSTQDAGHSASVKRDGVVVVGSANIDFVVKAKVLSRGEPSPVRTRTEGGKGANQAVAAARRRER